MKRVRQPRVLVKKPDSKPVENAGDELRKKLLATILRNEALRRASSAK